LKSVFEKQGRQWSLSNLRDSSLPIYTFLTGQSKSNAERTKVENYLTDYVRNALAKQRQQQGKRRLDCKEQVDQRPLASNYYHGQSGQQKKQREGMTAVSQHQLTNGEFVRADVLKNHVLKLSLRQINDIHIDCNTQIEQAQQRLNDIEEWGRRSEKQCLKAKAMAEKQYKNLHTEFNKRFGVDVSSQRKCKCHSSSSISEKQSDSSSLLCSRCGHLDMAKVLKKRSIFQKQIGEQEAYIGMIKQENEKNLKALESEEKKAQQTLGILKERQEILVQEWGRRHKGYGKHGNYQQTAVSPPEHAVPTHGAAPASWVEQGIAASKAEAATAAAATAAVVAGAGIDSSEMAAANSISSSSSSSSSNSESGLEEILELEILDTQDLVKRHRPADWNLHSARQASRQTIGSCQALVNDDHGGSSDLVHVLTHKIDLAIDKLLFGRSNTVAARPPVPGRQEDQHRHHRQQQHQLLYQHQHQHLYQHQHQHQHHQHQQQQQHHHHQQQHQQHQQQQQQQQQQHQQRQQRQQQQQQQQQRQQQQQQQQQHPQSPEVLEIIDDDI
jgi:hypothetical protein